MYIYIYICIFNWFSRFAQDQIGPPPGAQRLLLGQRILSPEERLVDEMPTAPLEVTLLLPLGQVENWGMKGWSTDQPPKNKIN